MSMSTQSNQPYYIYLDIGCCVYQGNEDDPHGWYFEPADYDGGTHFSESYASKDEATQAAFDWYHEQEWQKTDSFACEALYDALTATTTDAELDSIVVEIAKEMQEAGMRSDKLETLALIIRQNLIEEQTQ